MSAQSEPTRDLTEHERRELAHRMEVVAAIAWGTESLLYRRDPFAEGVKEYASNVRSKWGMAMVILAAIAAWLGRDSPDFSWLHLLGTTALIFLAGVWYLPVLAHWFDAERKLELLDAQLWEMQYRWLANGGNDAQFRNLKALHQPGIGMNRDSSEYGEWWRAVRAELQEKAMLLP